MTNIFGLDDGASAWRQTAHNFAQDTLRRAILDGSLPGGTRLVQSDIAHQLGISTTPVREALRQLAADGLVVFDAHTGAVVRQFERDELVEVYDLLKALCPLALERAAAYITDEEIEQALELLKRSEEDTDAATWAKYHMKFHNVIEEASRAPTLSSILHNLHETSAIHIVRHLKTETGQQIRDIDHMTIIEALQAGDGDRAGQIMIDSLETGLRLLLASLDADQVEEAAPRDRRARRDALLTVGVG